MLSNLVKSHNWCLSVSQQEQSLFSIVLFQQDFATLSVHSHNLYMAHHCYICCTIIVLYLVLWNASVIFGAPVRNNGQSETEETESLWNANYKSENSNCRQTRSSQEDQNCTASLRIRNIHGKFPVCNTKRVQKIKVHSLSVKCLT